MAKVKIISMYWNNISSDLIKKQQEVFSSLGLRIYQFERTGERHGFFLDKQLEQASKSDVLVFVDIDCFPTNRKIFDQAINFAKLGGIFGCSQVASHLNNPYHKYVGPMFHAIKKDTWLKIGSPSYDSDANNDVGQNVTRQAQKYNIKMKLLKPIYSLLPRWRHGNDLPFGIGTFYKGGIFHLFATRKGSYNKIFMLVADMIIKSVDIDYLFLTNEAQKLENKLKRKTFFGLIKKPFRIWRDFFRSVRNSYKNFN